MCIFCKIANGEIPSHCIYEDETVMAFLDISQVSKGHTLIIPKKHYENFLTCDTELIKHVFEVAHMLGNQLVKELNAKGMNLLSNINEIAGQTVMHFHVHLIPRYGEDHLKVEFLENKAADRDIETVLNILK